MEFAAFVRLFGAPFHLLLGCILGMCIVHWCRHFREVPCLNLVNISVVLIYDGGFCNGYNTKQISHLQSLPS
jgi:hypothetical protein